jgi:hypothetical protein
MQTSGLRLATFLLATAATAALAAQASAQLLGHKDISAEMAVTIAQTAIATCKANGYKVSSTVVGRNGEIIAQMRGDDTGPHTIENSFRKAGRAGRAAERRPDAWADPSQQCDRQPGRAADQSGRGDDRRGRRFRRPGRRKGRCAREAAPCARLLKREMAASSAANL